MTTRERQCTGGVSVPYAAVVRRARPGARGRVRPLASGSRWGRNAVRRSRSRMAVRTRVRGTAGAQRERDERRRRRTRSRPRRSRRGRRRRRGCRRRAARRRGRGSAGGRRGEASTPYGSRSAPPLSRLPALLARTDRYRLYWSCPWLYLIDQDRLQQPSGLQQRPADRIRRVRIESGARLPWDVLDRYDGSAGGAFAVRAESGAAVRRAGSRAAGPRRSARAPQAERAHGRPQRDGRAVTTYSSRGGDS